MASASDSSVRLAIVRGPTSPPLQCTTFGNLIRQRAQESANKIALISQNQDEILTYSVLHKRSDDLAAGLLAAGVGKGDRVAVLLGNRLEYVDVSEKTHSGKIILNMLAKIFFACAKVQAIITLLNYAYTPAELKHTLSSTKTKILITNLKSGKYDYTHRGPALPAKCPPPGCLHHLNGLFTPLDGSQRSHNARERKVISRNVSGFKGVPAVEAMSPTASTRTGNQDLQW